MSTKRLTAGSLLLMLIWAHESIAVAPPLLKADLAKLEPQKMMLNVASMPASLKGALKATFRQKRLEMSDPHGPLGSTQLIIAGDERGFAPMRRLIFAFESEHFFVVYYEKGHPEGGASPIVFRKAKSGPAVFVWGGLDEQRNYANSPKELASRILADKIRDNLPFVW